MTRHGGRFRFVTLVEEAEPHRTAQPGWSGWKQSIAAAWADGQAMAVDEAIADALGQRGEP